jgi:outer membrane immunogenic protein
MSSMRKKYLLATVSIAALACGSGIASAADISIPKARAVAVPYAGWTGPYIGLHAGAVRHESTAYDLDHFGVVTDAVPVRNSGGLVGGHIGYNWQSGSLVSGFEVDLSGVFHKQADVTFTGAGFGSPELQQIFSSKLRWLSTFRFRAGLAYQATMVYVTAGLAAAGIDNRWGAGFTDGSLPPFAFQFESDRTQWGWTVGGGIDHKVTPNWSVRLEGLYVDLGRSKTVTHRGANTEGGTTTADFRSHWENTAIIARVGVTHHWDAGPVLAKY